MRTIAVSVGLALTIASMAAPTKTRVEVVKTTTPADDAKPNSPDVPEAMAAVGKFERVFVFRFKHQADLLGGMEKLVRQHGINNAVILSGVGSVRDYHVHTVSNSTFPSKNIYTKDTNAPADVVSINGMVIDGRVHAHVTLVDPDKAFGGHLEPGTHVFTFAVVTLAELSSDTDMSRFADKTYR